MFTAEQKKEAEYRASYKPMPIGVDWTDLNEAVGLCGGRHFPEENARSTLMKLLTESDSNFPFDFDFELLQVLVYWRRRKREIDALPVPPKIGG